ncbi:hypothetical protein [uncultured Eubacterium sp.]|uniref:hypothetical protein n=1 Tax=uncultured Eubacterium sp. TaxID=165185 RepID=UPI002671C0E8|nr:hypothetical protein [uncultured Eubacterium sp.]
MNKRAYIFCLIVFICGFAIAYIVGVKIGTDEGDSLKEKVVNVSPEKEKETEAEGYWVKTTNNKIIVYQSDGTTVVAETDIDISRLPETDRSVLEHGIYLESAEELFKYLEANTS